MLCNRYDLPIVELSTQPSRPQFFGRISASLARAVSQWIQALRWLLEIRPNSLRRLPSHTGYTSLMASPDATEFRLSVLNPGGRDLPQDFGQRFAADTAHPPTNFHAFAACTGGSFQRDVRKAIEEETAVLLLIRGDFKATERALIELKRQKRTVAVSLKETGLHQIADQLRDPAKLSRFLRIVNRADGCIATTPEAAAIYRQARPEHDPATVDFIPTPYPVEDRQWNFAVPPDEQSGIFVGTREWDVPSRNHLAALLLARELCHATGELVTIFNLDGRKGAKRLSELKFPPRKLRVIERRRPYHDYLREVARHKIVLQLDRSHVPGQVAGDAVLCRTVCVGGYGATERIAFPNFCGEGRTTEQLGSIAIELLTNANARAAAIMDSQRRGVERLSFQTVRSQLEAFFGRLQAKSGGAHKTRE